MFDGTKRIFTRDADEIAKVYNLVRYRAGLPGVSAAALPDRNTMRDKIKHERMIEFLFENRRFFDVRRWGDYEKSENEPMMGMNVNSPLASYYNRVVIVHDLIARRVVDRRMLFLPINYVEMKRLPRFDQNPGWE